MLQTRILVTKITIPLSAVCQARAGGATSQSDLLHANQQTPNVILPPLACVSEVRSSRPFVAVGHKCSSRCLDLNARVKTGDGHWSKILEPKDPEKLTIWPPFFFHSLILYSLHYFLKDKVLASISAFNFCLCSEIACQPHVQTLYQLIRFIETNKTKKSKINTKVHFPVVLLRLFIYSRILL